MRRTIWFAVGVTVVVLGGSGFIPSPHAKPLLADAVLAMLALSATAVLYINFPTPARQAICGEIRRGRSMVTIARRHRWPVDVVRALAEGETPVAAGHRSRGRLFRSSGRSRRPLPGTRQAGGMEVTSEQMS